MSFKVVVAEKPSVARDISKVIGANAKKNGFYEGNNYRVTWCIGHLVTLSYPETYDIKYKKWKIEYLPIIPEDMKTEVIREVKEETGIEVLPSKMLFVEDLESKSRRMVKIWFLCKFIGGKLIKTKAAAQEGIVDVNWYTKEQLENETVYPQILKEVDWKIFKRKTFELRYFGFVKADF